MASKKTLIPPIELAFIQRDDVYTNTWVIAQNLGYEHRFIVRHVVKHGDRLRKLGNYCPPRAIIQEVVGPPVKAYDLNEAQAIFIVSLLDNSDRVLDFKMLLASEFVRMRKLLLEQQTAEWQQARIDGKKVRLAETDAIKQLVEYAKAQGSEHADKLYMTYSKLVKQLTGYDKRDAASTELLYTVSVMERLIGGIIMQEMALNAGYKAIYQTAKGQLAAILHLWNTPLLLA
jgi:phage regulator Rha-like protein